MLLLAAKKKELNHPPPPNPLSLYDTNLGNVSGQFDKVPAIPNRPLNSKARRRSQIGPGFSPIPTVAMNDFQSSATEAFSPQHQRDRSGSMSQGNVPLSPPGPPSDHGGAPVDNASNGKPSLDVDGLQPTQQTQHSLGTSPTQLKQVSEVLSSEVRSLAMRPLERLERKGAMLMTLTDWHSNAIEPLQAEHSLCKGLLDHCGPSHTTRTLTDFGSPGIFPIPQETIESRRRPRQWP